MPPSQGERPATWLSCKPWRALVSASLLAPRDIVASSGGEPSHGRGSPRRREPLGLFCPHIFGHDGLSHGHITLAEPMAHPLAPRDARATLEVIPVLPCALRHGRDGLATTRLYRAVLAKNRALASAHDDRARRALALALLRLFGHGPGGISRAIWQHHRQAAPHRAAFSRRAPAVPSPALPLDRCALPLPLALRLLWPDVAADLRRRRLAPSFDVAARIALAGRALALSSLERVLATTPVIISKGDSLDLHGIAAFFAELVPGDAVGLSPLTMRRMGIAPGDPVTVHLPLGDDARDDACQRLMAPTTVTALDTGLPHLPLSPDALLGLSYLLDPPVGAAPVDHLASAFASPDDAIAAFDHGALSLDQPIVVRHEGRRVGATIGRLLVHRAAQHIALDELASPLTERSLAKHIAHISSRLGPGAAASAADALERLGLAHVTRRAPSLCQGSFEAPSARAAIFADARSWHAAIDEQYDEGLVTHLERQYKQIDTWSAAFDRVREHARRPDDLRRMAEALGPEASQRLMKLRGAVGLLAAVSGDIWARPVTASLGDGLSPHEVMMYSMGARRSDLVLARRDLEARALLENLVAALGDACITMHDCGSDEGATLGDLVIDGVTLLDAPSRRARRTPTSDGRSRTLVTCKAPRGVCRLCFGAPASPHAPPPAHLGLVAAFALARHATQLRARSLHICACGACFNTGNLDPTRVDTLSGALLARQSGSVSLTFAQAPAKRSDGAVVVVDHGTFVDERDDHGLSVRRIELPIGARLCVRDGDPVREGQQLATWNPFDHETVASAPGTVSLVDVQVGETLLHFVDEVTGLTHHRVTSHASRAPTLVLVPDHGDGPIHHPLRPSTRLLVEAGQRVEAGQVLACLHREPQRITPTGDIRWLRELLDGHHIGDPRLRSPIAGVVLELSRGQHGRRLGVVPRDAQGHPAYDRAHEIAAPPQAIRVLVGQPVEAGDALAEIPGPPDQTLTIEGPAAVASEIVEQLVVGLSLQGITLDERLAELVARQMLSHVRIVDPRASPFPTGATIPRHLLSAYNAALPPHAPRPEARDCLTGITRLATRSPTRHLAALALATIR